MGLSLADAAVRGTTFDQTIAEQKQSFLSAGDTQGLISLNHSLYGSATMMAKADDADDDADDDEDDDEDDSDDDDEDDDEDDEDDDDKGKAKKKKVDPRDVRITELSAEAKKKRLRIRTQSQRIAELEAENTRLKKGTKAKGKDDDKDDEDDSDSEETTRLKAENETLKTRLVRQDLRAEFTDLTTGDKPLAVFIDPKAAFRLLDLDDVEIDDEGEIDGLDDAIKALAKDKPYLVKPKAKAKDDEDDEDEEPTRRRTGQPTRSRKKGNPNREKLVSKYPALRR